MEQKKMQITKLSSFYVSKNALNKNINFTGKDKIHSTKFDSPEVNSDIQQQNSKKKYAGFTIGGCGIGAAIMGLIAKFKKPSSNLKGSIKVVEKLIKTLKPENAALARNVYPVLLENAEILRIKPENFNSIMESITESNRDFMLQDGIKLLASKMEKLKDCITSPQDDITNITKYLNQQNKKIFDTVTEDVEKFKITDSDDIVLYLRKLNPDNYDYMFNTIMPELSKYETPFKLNIADRYTDILNHITPETEDMISRIAETYTPETKSINRFGILINTTANNKDCVIPLINNASKLEYNSRDIIKTLQSVNNSKASVIDAIADNIEIIKKMEIKPDNLLNLITDSNSAKIFNTVISNSELYKISDIADIKFYLKNLNAENLDFIEKSAMPKLYANLNNLGIEYAEQIAEILQKMTPETVESIDIVSKYAEKLGNHLYYPALLEAVDKNNIKKLPLFMENISKTELWDNFMVSVDDFRAILNSTKIG